MSELRKAAQAVVDRWDSPDWSDWTHTLDYIYRLRRAISTEQEQEPVAWMFPCDVEKCKHNETSVKVYSVCMGDPNKGETVPLYLHPQCKDEQDAN